VAKKQRTKSQDIRKLSEPDLKKEIEETYRRLFAIRLQKETLQLTNHRELPRTRRLIARLKSIQRERQLAKAAAARGAAR
jgi:large subunit ribosomal protein L29